MTEPKKEKCEACYGSGYINFWTDDGHISMRTCRRCDGYGYINVEPLTNEEYLRSLNTEQLAEEISHLVFGGDFKKHISKMGYINMHSFKTEIVEWLKQPHREESKK